MVSLPGPYPLCAGIKEYLMGDMEIPPQTVQPASRGHPGLRAGTNADRQGACPEKAGWRHRLPTHTTPTSHRDSAQLRAEASVNLHGYS